MASRPSIQLPDGRRFYLTSNQLYGAARFLRSEIFKQNRYHRPGFELKPDDVVIDIGANMGLFAAWAAPQVPEGRIIAIEPTDSIQCLELNVGEHDWRNVEILRLAVGDSEKDLELWHYPGFNIISHSTRVKPSFVTHALINLIFFNYREKPYKMSVKCQPFDRVMDRLDVAKVDYLKIDCEGSEYDIFQSLAPRQWKRIQKIVLEFHEYRADHRHELLVEKLKEQGFQVSVSKPWFAYNFMRYGEIWAWRQ